MDFVRREIPEVVEIRPKRHGDDRGYFAETFKRSSFEAEGLVSDYAQDNRSMSRSLGTVRGLHFQLPPFAQAKLVSVARGAILDVAVDVRRGSPTFGRHVAALLSAENGAQLYVPEGFAHGFSTLEPDTEVIYKVSRVYSAECERAIFWADPELSIDWRVSPADAVVSDKDAAAPRLSEAKDLFELGSVTA